MRRNPLSVLYFVVERTCGESLAGQQIPKNGANDSTAVAKTSVCDEVLAGGFKKD